MNEKYNRYVVTVCGATILMLGAIHPDMATTDGAMDLGNEDTPILIDYQGLASGCAVIATESYDDPFPNGDLPVTSQNSSLYL